MKKIFTITLMMLVALMSLSLESCTDILSEGGSIGEGKATVTLDFSFEPQGSALEMRGVPGNLDFGIKDLVILFYKVEADEENGKPTYAFEYDNSDGNGFTVYEKEGQRDQEHCEEYTYHGMVTITGIEYDKYRIYAVANVKKQLEAEYYKNDQFDISEKQLREIQIEWDKDYPKDNTLSGNNPDTYKIPTAMFGYFTNDVTDHTQKKYRDVIHHNMTLYKGNSPEGKTHEDVDKNRPEPVTIDKENLQIQAWLKRVVSKLTIGFDGSRLKEGVEIYIKSVSIKDAAEKCLLGHDNSVGDTYNDTEQTIELLPEDYDYTQDPRFYTEYSSVQGIVEGMAITKSNPAFPRLQTHTQTDISTADAKKPEWEENWYNYVHGKDGSAEGEHNGKHISLYFFENLQGISEGNVKGYNSDYDKSLGEKDPNYKDGKPNGTYVEVKAYYRNTYFGKESQGDITYRFMLGKNTTNDFNAERNFHYKLILSFVGDAKNVDWHIDYTPEEEEREEGFYFRIPYDQDYDIADQGYEDTENNEKWYDDENWKQSNVWYAYDDQKEPVAEIVKELVYWDEQDPDYEKRHIETNRKYYQIVSVYPVRKNSDGTFVTNFEKGRIAQVLACDTKAVDTKANGTLAMLTRGENNNNLIGTEGYRGYYVIKSLTWGGDGDLVIYNYVYPSSERNAETGEYELTLGSSPRNTKWETGAYQVEDTDKSHYYPVVKIGTAYWLRENLQTTHYSTKGSSYTTIYPQQLLNGDQWYGPPVDNDGYIGFHERYPMYKSNPEGNGYLYNYFALSGVDVEDFNGKYTTDGEADPYYELWIDSRYDVISGMLLQEGSGYWSGDVIYGSGEYKKYPSYNLQIAPEGWHVPTSSAAVGRLTDYTGMFMEARADHDYMEEYIDNNWARAIGNIDVNETNYGLNQNNLSNLCLHIQAVKDNQQISFNQVIDPQDLQDNMAIPYWTDLMQTAPIFGYEDDVWNGNFYANPPFLRYPDHYGSIVSRVYTVEDNANSTYWKEATSLYLPVRCVRHSNNYEAPAYDASNGRYVKIINE